MFWCQELFQVVFFNGCSFTWKYGVKLSWIQEKGHTQTVSKNEKFTLTEKIFRHINSLVTSLAKLFLSRNFCQKSVRVDFCIFFTLWSMCNILPLGMRKQMENCYKGVQWPNSRHSFSKIKLKNFETLAFIKFWLQTLLNTGILEIFRVQNWLNFIFLPFKISPKNGTVSLASTSFTVFMFFLKNTQKIPIHQAKI